MDDRSEMKRLLTIGSCTRAASRFFCYGVDFMWLLVILIIYVTVNFAGKSVRR